MGRHVGFFRKFSFEKFPYIFFPAANNLRFDRSAKTPTISIFLKPAEIIIPCTVILNERVNRDRTLGRTNGSELRVAQARLETESEEDVTVTKLRLLHTSYSDLNLKFLNTLDLDGKF